MLQRLATLISILNLLQQDTRSDAEQHRSDRAILLADVKPASDWALLIRWLRSQPDQPDQRPAFGVWLSVLALLLGVVSMLGMVSYSGERPINLLYWLLVFSVLQWLMMFLSVVGLLSRGQFPPSGRWWWQHSLHQTGLDRFPPSLIRILVFALNQGLASLYLIAAALCFLVVLSTQDLAFGWSTTLQLGSQDLLPWFSGLSQLWAEWWSAAVPTDQLINDTQFFRLAEPQLNELQVAQYGQWWPFLLMMLLSYSLLPRLLLLVVGVLLLRWQINRLPGQLTDIVALLSRMRTPLVDSGSEQTGHWNPEADLAQVKPVALSRSYISGALVLWGLAAEQVASDNAPALLLPGEQGYQNDKRLLAALAKEHDWLTVVVPGWEPPTGELSDLLQPLQPTGIKIKLLALPLTAEQPLTESDQLSWQHFVDHHLPWVELGLM